jgi:hypothetical protein
MLSAPHAYGFGIWATAISNGYIHIPHILITNRRYKGGLREARRIGEKPMTFGESPNYGRRHENVNRLRPRFYDNITACRRDLTVIRGAWYADLHGRQNLGSP